VIKLPRYKITVAKREESETNSHKYDAIINVSDSPTEGLLGTKDCFWYPINEMSNWGYGPFYWSKKVIDKCVWSNLYTLIHCDGGVCRSPLITVAWLYSTGHSKAEIDFLMGSDSYTRDFKRMQNENRIPPHLSQLHQVMRDNPTFSLMGCLGKMDRREDH
jgi:hypothetical protein